MTSPRAILVGGAGFLGSHVAACLRQRLGSDAEILVVGRNPQPAPPGTVPVAGDRDDAALIADLARRKPDLWFDLALFQPAQMASLVQSLAAADCRPRLVVAGTVAEYGLSRKLPVPVPESLPQTPESPYGRGKADAWELGRTEATRAGIGLTWAVLPQLWGPGDRHGRDALFVRQILADAPLLLRGSGRTLMPDGYVETAAAALVHLALAGDAGVGRFNVAGFQPLSPLTFIRWAAGALGRSARVLHAPHRALADAERETGTRYRPVFGDFDLVLDLGRLRRSGFQPELTSRVGVERTAAWHARGEIRVDPAFEPPAPLLRCELPGAQESLHGL